MGVWVFGSVEKIDVRSANRRIAAEPGSPDMHEMGIASQVVEIALASIPESHRNARVEQVNLKVGKLAAVVADSLRFCYEVIVRDTPLAGSALHIEEIPVTARCVSCDRRWRVDEPVFRCAVCRSGDVKIETGQELEIVSIEISDEISD